VTVTVAGVGLVQGPIRFAAEAPPGPRTAAPPASWTRSSPSLPWSFRASGTALVVACSCRHLGPWPEAVWEERFPTATTGAPGVSRGTTWWVTCSCPPVFATRRDPVPSRDRAQMPRSTRWIRVRMAAKWR